GVAKGFETQLLNKDGHSVWVSINARAIKDDEGTVIYHEGTVVDITNRKLSEEALNISRDNLRTIFNSVQDGIFIHDMNGKVIDVNAKMLAMYQVSYDQALSFSIEKDYSGPGNPLDQLSATWEKVVNGKSVSFEWIARRPIDGSVFPARIFLTSITMAGEDAVLASVTDVTAQKRLEGLLIQAQKLEAVGTLAGGLAHDFNNLLMGIQGHASLIMLELDTHHPHHERLKHIEEQVRSAADLTRQLLAFARGGRYEMRPVNIDEIMKRTSTMFGRTKKELTIHGKYDKDLWTVEADQGQIEQVFLNLYVNAWHAMPSGGELYLEAGNITLDKSYAAPYAIPPGNYVKISVTDTGTGMDEKTIKRIFDPFFTTKEMGRGTGLGLAMVYGIMKGHNGIINVYSEPGHGTTFILYLPASEKDVLEKIPSVPEVRVGSETILIVDDESTVLAVSKEILQSLGYTVHGMGSGEEAINFYKEMKDTIALVVLDMIMPGLSGSETFDRIRELDPSAKIILSSGYSLNGQAQKILDKGCHGFIQKPYDIAQISRKIREVLEG
ncbi:MAG: oxidoreductase, partial [Syntrophus sp. (in: bacteria)]|nr:oxidoreductase [Syntrophus sp. (in: bacteria)]